jgi:hypothetical protein
MIKGNSANEYGDFLIASLKDPYKDAVRIMDWEILVGLSDSNTVGTISLQRGSTEVFGLKTNFNFQQGDKIIVGNITMVIESQVSPEKLILASPSSITATNVEFFKPDNQYNFFSYEFRYSTDGKVYNEFHALNKQQDFGDLLHMTFNPRESLYLEVKAEVDTLIPGSKLTLISITYTLEKDNGIIESCPQLCLDCTDPFLFSGCANIRVDCEYDSLFKPYSLAKSQQVYLQLTKMANDIFGHDVTYFRTEPDMRTKDVILMEYSLFDVVDQQTLKILVPDNEFPQESTIAYNMFGMDFEEFEIHIVASEFEKVFGYKKKPRARDYMYIPLINKMYMISSIAVGDRFNATQAYWKVKLTKYSEDTAVDQNQFEPTIDSIVTNIDEVFGEEIQETYAKDTKPMQFQTVSTSYRDGIRQFIEKDLKIVDYELKNRWTVVSKNYYDLSFVKRGEVAMEYVTESSITNTDNFALTAWFKPQFLANYAAEEFFFGDYDVNNGFRTLLSAQDFKVIVNGITHTFEHNVTFDPLKWYAVILNGNNQFRELALYIYELDLSFNFNLPQSGDNDLVLKFSEVKSVSQAFFWNSNTNYHLKGGKLSLTNLRFFKQPVEFEQHSNVLNQYVVRDSQLAVIIDNAIPSIGFQKFRNAR